MIKQSRINEQSESRTLLLPREEEEPARAAAAAPAAAAAAAAAAAGDGVGVDDRYHVDVDDRYCSIDAAAADDDGRVGGGGGRVRRVRLPRPTRRMSTDRFFFAPTPRPSSQGRPCISHHN